MEIFFFLATGAAGKYSEIWKPILVLELQYYLHHGSKKYLTFPIFPELDSVIDYFINAM